MSDYSIEDIAQMARDGGSLLEHEAKALVTELDRLHDLAAAERAVVDTGLARYLAAERVVPKAEFFAVCNAFNDACRDLLRLRAAQESVT